MLFLGFILLIYCLIIKYLNKSKINEDIEVTFQPGITAYEVEIEEAQFYRLIN